MVMIMNFLMILTLSHLSEKQVKIWTQELASLMSNSSKKASKDKNTCFQGSISSMYEILKFDELNCLNVCNFLILMNYT
jgi:hypothetical protein